MGGNRKAREFFESHGEVQRGMSLYEKYNTRTAALYRDKVTDNSLFVQMYTIFNMFKLC